MQEKRSINLCSNYILPLIGLNSSNFGIGNFVNSYVNNDDKHLVVELNQSASSVVKALPTFRFNFEKDNHHFLVFEIPNLFKPVLRLFREGKYSKFPEDAKEVIRKKSGLRYKHPTGDGKSVTSARELMALNKDIGLRKKLEAELDTRLPADAELASIPGPENFYELILSTELVN